MASIDHTPVRGTDSNHNAVDNKDQFAADANYIEHAQTTENDIALAKLPVDAKVDKFGARSKTTHEEIALVKKLDRTILVSSQTPFENIKHSDSSFG